MASQINASNSGFGGIVSTGDSSGVLQLQTAGTTAVTIDTSQNVGIGKTPTTKLDVNGSLNVASSMTMGSANWFSYGTDNTFYSDSSYGLVIKAPATSNFIAFRSSNDTERMRIDSSGRVTTPYQPSFSVADLTFPSGTSGVGTGGTVVSNIGSYYNSSNGRFTAPVAGTYLFNLSVQAFNSGSTTYVNVALLVNASTSYGNFVTGYGGTYNNHTQITGNIIIYLNANDYAQAFVNYGARSGAQNIFSGFLLG